MLLCVTTKQMKNPFVLAFITKIFLLLFFWLKPNQCARRLQYYYIRRRESNHRSHTCVCCLAVVFVSLIVCSMHVRLRCDGCNALWVAFQSRTELNFEYSKCIVFLFWFLFFFFEFIYRAKEHACCIYTNGVAGRGVTI